MPRALALPRTLHCAVKAIWPPIRALLRKPPSIRRRRPVCGAHQNRALQLRLWTSAVRARDHQVPPSQPVLARAIQHEEVTATDSRQPAILYSRRRRHQREAAHRPVRDAAAAAISRTFVPGHCQPSDKRLSRSRRTAVRSRTMIALGDHFRGVLTIGNELAEIDFV